MADDIFEDDDEITEEDLAELADHGRQTGDPYRGMHRETREMIAVAGAFLAEEHPESVRGVYYHLLMHPELDHIFGAARRSTDPKLHHRLYRRVKHVVKVGRLRGFIEWEHIHDKLRVPTDYSGGQTSVAEFIDGLLARPYFRDIWAGSEERVELWCEKDALVRNFEDAAFEFSLCVSTGRGFDSMTAVKNAVARFAPYRRVTILHFGDLDPSGVVIPKSLEKNLPLVARAMGAGLPEVRVVRCALLPSDVKEMRLPKLPISDSDPRAPAFRREYGGFFTELDAMPRPLLRERVRAEAMKYVDLERWRREMAIQEEERARIRKLLTKVRKSFERE